MTTILLVEDDQRVSSVYLQALREVNASISLANGVSEALSIARSCEDLAVVITDYRLTDGDGLSLVQSIQHSCAERSWIQFVLITGHASISVAQRAIELGIRHLLTKPIQREEFASIATSTLLLSGHIRRQRMADDSIVSTLADVERKLGSLSRSVQIREEVSRNREPYRSRVLTELQRELDRSTRIERAFISEREWVLLLQVAAGELEDKPVTLKGAAYVMNTPLSSLIRTANSLVERGLLERWDDPNDARRTFLRLTERADAVVKTILTGQPEQKIGDHLCTA